EAVKQQQRGRIGAAGLAIEDLQAVHIGRTIFDDRHCVSPSGPIGPYGIDRLEAVFCRSGSEYSPSGRHSSAARSNRGLANGRYSQSLRWSAWFRPWWAGRFGAKSTVMTKDPRTLRSDEPLAVE